MSLLYQGTLLNQLGWLLLTISYFISSLGHIIHNIPTWYNTSFNTNLVIISSSIEFLKYKLVSSLLLINLMDIISTNFPYSYSLSSNKLNWNMSNTFNNEVVSALFGFRIFTVCSIMVRKWDHWIVSFIEVGQYKSLSWRSISFLLEGLYKLASIYFIYAAASILSFRYWNNAGWLIYFNKS